MAQTKEDLVVTACFPRLLGGTGAAHGPCCVRSKVVPTSQELTAVMPSTLGRPTHLKMGGGVVGLGVRLQPVTLRRDTDKPGFYLGLR